MSNMDEITKIKALMEERGMTVTKLSRMVNQPQGKVANWFTRGGVPKKHLKLVASVLGVTVDYLLI